MAICDVLERLKKICNLSWIKPNLEKGLHYSQYLALMGALILGNFPLNMRGSLYMHQEHTEPKIEDTDNMYQQYLPLISNQPLAFGVHIGTGINPELINYLTSSGTRISHVSYNPGSDRHLNPEGYPNLPIACMQPTGEVDWTCAEQVEDTIRNIRERLGGVEIDLVITGAPEWARDGQFVNEEYWDEYAQFIVEVIGRFSQYPYKVKNYAIWNEVELAICIHGLLGCGTDPETFARFYNTVQDAVENKGLDVNLMPSDFSHQGVEYLGQFLVHASDLDIKIERIRVHYYEMVNKYKVNGLTHHYLVEGGITGQIDRIDQNLEKTGYEDTEILITEFNMNTTEFYTESSTAPTCNDPELLEEKAKYVGQFLQEVYDSKHAGYKIRLVDMYSLAYLTNNTWSCAGMIDPINKKLAPHAAVFALTYPLEK